MSAKNPPIKDNLESSHFNSFSSDVKARLTSCLRSDPAHIGTFSPASDADAIAAIQQGLNKVQPKNPPMKLIVDAKGTYGSSTVDAVLVYKSNNGIIRQGQKLDNIVGRMTLARLDTELKNLGSVAPKPPTPGEAGSNNFRFSFFCTRPSGDRAENKYELFIATTEGQGSGSFKVNDPFISGDTKMRFRGETKGFFKTEKKLFISQFGKDTNATLKISRLSKSLQGFIRLTVDSLTASPTSVQFFLSRFADESPEFLFTDGTLDVFGGLVPR